MPDAVEPTAVCLTGQLRWSALTLANLRQFVLRELHSWRGYYVGPADAAYAEAKVVLHNYFATHLDTCAYAEDVHWTWASNTSAFELHDEGPPCAHPAAHRHQSPRTAPRLTFNAERLPLFEWCRGGHQRGEVFLPLPPGNHSDLRTQYKHCSSALSVVLQLWQATQCVELIEAAERRKSQLRHGAVLRLRPDIFFFHAIRLPHLPQSSQPFYSMFEETCSQMSIATHRTLYGGTNKDRKRVVQDFWLYGSRDAMLMSLREPLRVLVSHDQNERRDPSQRQITLKAGSIEAWLHTYYVQPWPHALVRLFNASCCCINYRGVFGLLRVNPIQRCFTVQARLGRVPDKHYNALKARWWRAIDMKVAEQRWLNRYDLQTLRTWGAPAGLFAGVAEVYERCLQLKSNSSCPRLVGDRLVAKVGSSFNALRNCSFHTRERWVSRTTASGVSNDLTIEVSSACGQQSDTSFELTPQASEAAFTCVDAGLARLLTSGAVATR